MRSFLLRKILHNFWMKLLSFVIAILIWCAIMNSSDPTITSSIKGIMVTQINADAIKEENMTPTVIKGDKIDIKVSGPRSEVTNLDASDVKAYIDLKELSLTNSCPIHVEFKNAEATKNTEITSKSEEVVIISIEAMGNESKQVKIDLKGAPREGYYAVASVSPLLVDVYGSLNVVNQIDHLVASVDVSDVDNSFTAKAAVVPYDNKGNVIEDNSISIETKSVDVKVDVFKTKNVNISVNAEVSADVGFACEEVNHAPKTVTIAGPSYVLASLTEIKIPFKASNLKETVSDNIPLEELIPDGCYLVSDIEYISVTVPVVRLSENKKIDARLRNVTAKNLKADFKIANLNELVPVSVWGAEGTTGALSIVDLLLYVDCNEITKPGVYELEVKSDSDKNIMFDAVKVKVEVEASTTN